ncbi:MAG TPA: tetratricopeptide repeat protein [Candidatus Polarisedimenticolia bacterium]|nr:tetratricopeptide repeat protein [Candidatus Polarisedimenticolia bacterium]
MKARVLPLLAAPAILLLASRPSAAAPVARSTRDLIQAGVAALEESNFARAGARFREAAAIDPRLPQVQIGLGLAALGERDRKTAERAFRLASELSGRAAEALYVEGVARFVFGDLRAAEDDLRAAAGADRYFIEARYAAGIVEAARGDLTGSAGILREALRIDAAHAASHYQLGAVLARGGDLDGALEELGKALSIDPSILDARPEDPFVFAERSVKSTAPGNSFGMPLPVPRPSINWPRARPGAPAAPPEVPAWFLYYQMALDLEGASEWRGAVDMLERALALKDRSEPQAIVADRLADYCPHLHLAEDYQRLGNYREASLHLGIARNEGNVPPERLKGLEALILKDRLRPRVYLQALPDRTVEQTVTVRGVVLADEPVARVEVGGREAVLRPATTADLSALLPPGEAAPPRDAGISTLFEVTSYRLGAIGPNLIPIRAAFHNPARDADRVEVMVVRQPPQASAPPSPPKAGAHRPPGAP